MVMACPPYAQAELPPLVAYQRYDISLHLQVPNLDSTYTLGNFMTTLTLSTRSNKTLSSIRRPAIVTRPRVSFFSSTPRGRRRPASRSGGGITGKSLGEQGREVSVVSASLRGVVVHHGIRGVVTRLPLLSAFVSSIIFLAISSLIAGVCILPLTFRHTTQPPEPEPQFPNVDIKPLPAISSSSSDDSESPEDEKPLVPRRRSRPSSRTVRTYGSSHHLRILTGNVQGIKTEDAPTTILPPAVPQATPLRRRRSKIVDPVSSDSSES
ncbi:hypothetical protein MSAN_02173500 [Mycena sanguinolenta]|uniref:Uncharacterized protein n=1 Tax=Mycena sanguinolenta TaxID=230812 RepID=A0A8H6XFS9_9AGAR|nr:hypothetical protein MSAN_02173500 [Mycena sanguinolenta]